MNDHIDDNVMLLVTSRYVFGTYIYDYSDIYNNLILSTVQCISKKSILKWAYW